MTNIIGNRYEVGTLIGEGAMGEVYLGRDSGTREAVAIKALKSSVATPDLITRFEREAEALRQLNHPNIVKGLDSFQENGQHFLVMEYVEGGSLQQLMFKQAKMSVHQTLRIALELADALTRAHLLNIVHRDLKPANVLLAKDETPRLTDFGIASIASANRVTQTGTIVGTLDYLSPEACRGEEVDNRTDIWSFGVMLYEMLAGVVPFKGGNLGEIIYNILNNPMPDLTKIRPDVPSDLVTLIERMLEKNREDRLNSVRIVGADIEAILRGEKTTTSTMRPVTKTLILDSKATPTTTLGVNLATSFIPVQTTPFVGRQDELEEIHELLQNPDCRHITLLGPGGMGKTRLSIEVASQHRDLFHDFADGIFFIALAPLNHKEEIITGIADTLQFNFFGSEPPITQLANYLREKNMLLVLDNFEHLMNCTSLVSDILSAAPNIKVITTSREKLNLSGEWVFNVEPMTFPDYKSPEDLKQYGAIQLFMQSARRARPDFTLTEENQDTVVEIVQLVQGLPLGIELAAAWLEVLRPEEIVAEMQTSFDFLETDLRDVPERHRSIRAVFDYSWNLMTDDERSAFSKLSIFKGGFTREAAAVVTGALLRPLTMLVNKSLLRRLPSGRYEVHELLRQYASEKLAEDPETETAILSSHCDYYLDYVANNSLTSQPYLEWLGKLSDELENIRAALKYSFNRQRGDKLRAMLPSMHLFYESRSLFREGLEVYQSLIDIYRGNEDYCPLYLVALSRAGTMRLRLSDFKNSQADLEEALKFARDLGNKAEESWALTWLSYAQMSIGDYDEALKTGLEAIQTAEASQSKHSSLLTPLGHVGYVYYLMGDYPKAIELIKQAGDMAKQTGNVFAQAFHQNNLGEVMREKGEFGEAKQLFEAAYNTFSEIGYLRGMAFSINNLGGILQGIGDIPTTESMYRRSYRLNKQIGDRVGIGHSLSALGNIAYLQGKIKEAKGFYEQALQIRREMNDRRGISESLQDLGYALMQAQEFDSADAVFLESLGIQQEINDPIGEARTLLYMTELELWRGDYAKARERVEAGYSIAQKHKNPFGLAWGVVNIAVLQILEGNYQAAIDNLEGLFPIAVSNEYLWLLAWGNTLIALAKMGLGDYEMIYNLLIESIERAQKSNNTDTLNLSLVVLGKYWADKGDAEAAVSLILPSLRRGGQPVPVLAHIFGTPLLETLKNSLSPQRFAELQSEAQKLTTLELAQQILATATP